MGITRKLIETQARTKITRRRSPDGTTSPSEETKTQAISTSSISLQWSSRTMATTMATRPNRTTAATSLTTGRTSSSSSLCSSRSNGTPTADSSKTASRVTSSSQWTARSSSSLNRLTTPKEDRTQDSCSRAARRRSGPT